MSVDKEEVSAFMDGELARVDRERVARTLCEPGGAGDVWRAYHCVGDAIRGSARLSPDFSRRLAARLADEPVVLAPRAASMSTRSIQRFALPIAATVAAVSLVGWLGWQTFRLPTIEAGIPMAASTPPEGAPIAGVDGQRIGQGRTSAAPEAGVPQGAHDYLFAHEVYSPRAAIQGAMPYVRAVSDPAPRAQAR